MRLQNTERFASNYKCFFSKNGSFRIGISNLVSKNGLIFREYLCKDEFNFHVKMILFVNNEVFLTVFWEFPDEICLTRFLACTM